MATSITKHASWNQWTKFRELKYDIVNKRLINITIKNSQSNVGTREKIVFDEVYSYLNTNNLLSKNQSGFRPGDSTIFQLLLITSTIYESFEKFDETRAVFLDISKAFDKVWHEGIIFKLKCNGISGNLLNFSIIIYIKGFKGWF